MSKGLFRGLVRGYVMVFDKGYFRGIERSYFSGSMRRGILGT